MTYVFDIDGTICSIEDDYSLAKPCYEKIKVINELYDNGATITFNTARGMGRANNSQALAFQMFYDFTKKQLDSWGVKYHNLFLGKPSGDIYVDDKGISEKTFFNNWGVNGN